MGPMIPLLFLVPILVGATWLFRDILPIALIFGVGAIGIVVEYCRQFSRFATTDPDRLQSEEYRCEMTRIHMVAGKELPHSIPAEELHLPGPVSNPAHPLPDHSDGQESLVVDDRTGKERDQ